MHKNLQQEVTRLVMRYCNEVVIHFNFCPWARSAIQENRINISILEHSASSSIQNTFLPIETLQQCAGHLSSVEKNPKIELVLLVFPHLATPRIAFDDTLRSIRELHELSRKTPGFAMAAFHPSAHANFFSPERLIPFIRRTPFPIIQAVKVEALNKINPKESVGTAYVDPSQLANFDLKQLSQPEPLRKKIARANLDTIKKASEAAVEERLQLIFSDRNSVFNAINLAIPSQWV